jgi:hypothetical protein
MEGMALSQKSNGDHRHAHGNWDHPRIQTGRPEMQDIVRDVQAMHRVGQPLLRSKAGRCEQSTADHPTDGVFPYRVPEPPATFP